MKTQIGKVFGMLTVTGPAEPLGNRQRVTYRCECGVVGVRRSDQLVGAVSCGCVRKAKAAAMSSARLVDVSGVRFGRLVATGRASDVGDGPVRWNCVCDCGGTAIVMAENLRSGNTCSCGCARRDGATVRSRETREAKNAYVKKRYREDIRFALDMRVRASIHKHLRTVGEPKSGRMREVLGYGSLELKDRLLSTMPDGYDWRDFLSGDLHIDHIIPLAAFNFAKLTDLDFRRAWALTNLQLLPAAKNIQKSDSLPGQFQPSLLF